MILTKKPWIYDPNGDRDRDDITDAYKNKEGNDETSNRRSLYDSLLPSETQSHETKRNIFINVDSNHKK
jgi:transglutaminase 1